MDIYRQPLMENSATSVVVVKMSEEQAAKLLSELHNTEEVEVECPGGTGANNWACEYACAGHEPNTMIFADQETLTTFRDCLDRVISPVEHTDG